MSKKRSKVRFQNEFDLIKVHYKKQSRGQSLTCLDMFNGRRHLRKRSAAGILWGSLLLTVISATVLGKTTTVVYASDVEKYTNADFAMDTVVSETLYTSGEDINTQIGEKLREMETTLLSWTEENSQISQLNNADGKTMEVSDELAADLEKIRQLSQESDGAFDPTLGKIIRLWDIDGENPHVPDQSEIDTLLPEVGYEKIQMDGNNVTLLDGCTLDLGAVGKGMGCDLIMDYLRSQPDVSGMILNLGGSSVMTYGEKPDGSPWKVALTDPRDTEGDYLGCHHPGRQPVPFHLRRLRKILHRRWNPLPPHPGSKDRLPRPERSHLRHHRLRPGLSGRRPFHRLLRPWYGRRETSFREI